MSPDMLGECLIINYNHFSAELSKAILQEKFYYHINQISIVVS